MSETVLTNALLIDPATSFEGPGALRIADGAIVDVAKGAPPQAPEGATVIDCGGKPLAPGIVDMRVSARCLHRLENRPQANERV